MEEGKEAELGFIKWFSKINKNLIDSVGEKGASLGELFSKNIPVPNGFVVTTDSYSKFLESSDLNEKMGALLEGVDFGKEELVKEVCEKIRDLILKSEFPEELEEEIIDSYESLGTNKLEIEKGSALDILNSASEPIFVSVRSSLPFKGIKETPVREQNTYLNVKGNDSLLDHVKSCFASLFNPKTLRRNFLKDKNLDKFRIAVIVQKMVPAEKSGFVISKDLSGNLSISAIWGLGEGMNVKEISPDKYVLSKELELLDKKIGVKNFRVVRDSSGALKSVKSSEERKSSQVLNNYEIQRLGDLSEKIESVFGSPQRIEFSVDESGLYILQSRGIDKLEEGSLGEYHVLEKKEESTSSEVEKVEKITKTKLKLVLDSPYLIGEGDISGLKKIGILKLEKIIKKGEKHPFYFLESNYINEYENLIYKGIKPVVDNFDEVWIRTSDFLSDQFSILKGAPKDREGNPLLGLHGIRFGLRYPEVLEAELRAFKRVSSKKKIGILIPNIISVKELKAVKDLLKKLGFDDLLVGILIETPSSVQLIKDFCEEGIDSIVINSDRLMQYLLAIDELNPKVKKLIDSSHPSFMYQLEYLVRVSKRNKVETNIFGSSTGNEKVLENLIQRGIDFVLVEPRNAKNVSERIFSIENRILKGTDSEPRKYEIEKSRKEYIKEDSEIDKVNKGKKDNKEIEELFPKNEKDLEKDLELIEKEKKEYLSKSEENLEEESKEEPEKDSENESKEEPKNHQENESKEESSNDFLGIF